MNRVLEMMMGGYNITFSPLVLDAYTYICLLQGCYMKKKTKAKTRKEKEEEEDVLNEGRIIHSHIIKIGFKHNVFLWTTMVDMYAKHGHDMDDAMSVFYSMPVRNLASWNVIISGYVKLGYVNYASQLIKDFMIPEGMMPDTTTIMTMIQACSVMKDLDNGRLLHSYVLLYTNFKLGMLVTNSLIDMYAKCGSLDDSGEMFDKMLTHDIVSWNAMISAYASSGHPEKSLECFQDMLQKGIHMINDVTILCTLNASASIGSLEQGHMIHSLALKSGLQCVENAVINMYGKCGDMESCLIVFERMQQDTVSWNSMISGYAQSGCGSEALKLFMLWLHDNVKPDIVSVVGVVSACDHSGLVDDGCHFFTEMYESCTNSNSAQEHHICMIDMFGRVGRVDEAADYIEKMPCQPLANAWRALLGACRIHGDVTKAEEAARASLELEPENEVAHILLFNTYAAKEKIDPSI